LINITPVGADELGIISNISIANRQFDYASNNNEVAGDIVTAGLGLTLTYGRFYADIDAENSITSNNESAIGFSNNLIDFKRSDFTLSTGYALQENLSLFIGYKQGKTTINARAENNTNTIELLGKGLFFGVGSGTRIKDWGVLSFSAAYASLNATYQDDQTNGITGRADGTSLAVTWQGQLDRHWHYNFALIRHDYFYDGFPLDNFRIREDILSLQAGLAYRF